MIRFRTMKWSRIHMIIVFYWVAWASPAVFAASALSPGTYRCSSYNVSGGSGSCRYLRPFVLKPDGSYSYASTRGHWRTSGHTLYLSNAHLWGAGEILNDRTVRFTYDYRGWRQTVTWICQECQSGGAGAPGTTQGANRGVSLTLKFGRSVGGVDGFTIVPVADARNFGRNAPLPEGAIEGLAWASGDTVVSLTSNRYNFLRAGQRYVIFLEWPAETIPVAILDLPDGRGDYAATLPATLNSKRVLAQLGGGPHPAVHARPAPPAAPLPQEKPVATAPRVPVAKPEASKAAAAPKKCNPLIPHYAQPGCVE